MKLLALALLAPVAAQAQQAGVYSGATADGTKIEVMVAPDPTNDVLEVTSICATFTAASCQLLSYPGFDACGGPGSDISGSKATLLTKSQTKFVSANMHFNRNQVSGTLTLEVPLLAKQDHLMAAGVCGVSRQAFTAALDGGTQH